MDTALAQLHNRLAALEQENVVLRSRLQSCERSHAVLQAEVKYQRRRQDGQGLANQEPIAEPATPGDLSLEHRLLEVTAEVTNALLTIAPFDQAVHTALQLIGEALETDRVGIAENFDLSTSTFSGWRVLPYGWNLLGTVPQHSKQDAVQGSYEDVPEFFEALYRGQSLSYLIEAAPEPFRSAQIAIGVKATHVVPISVGVDGGAYWEWTTAARQNIEMQQN